MKPTNEPLAYLANYFERGRECSLWGVKASDMTREQLTGFIGLLDELREQTLAGKGPTPSKQEA